MLPFSRLAGEGQPIPTELAVSDLIDLTAVDLLAAFGARTVSPLDYWDVVEQRIAAWEPRIAAL